MPSGGPLALAVRDAARFDRSAMSARAGLLAAIPVAAVLALGSIAWDPVAGVTMGAGAMLVGIAWRVQGGRPSLVLLGIDAFAMSLSTFVGCMTGSVPWLHLLVLFVWALVGGLLVSLGNRGGVIGTQAVIAVVVFGRFSQPVAASLALAGLVLAGGWAQVLFLSIVRGPGSLREQRAATAAAYRILADLTTASSKTSTLPAATALDEARSTLSSLTLFGDPALMTLRSLVNEGHRLRIGLSAIHALVGPEPAIVQLNRAPETADRILKLTGEALGLSARAIEGDRDAGSVLRSRVDDLSAETDALAESPDTAGSPLTRRLSALAGQVRAVAALAVAAGESGTLRERRPRRAAGGVREQATADLAQIRANASLQSPAGRHALRLAVVILISEVISRHVPLSRGYWMVVAAATTLRPEFGATFTRGTERVLGTCLGVGLAGAIAVALHPAGALTTVIVGLLAWAGYALFPASFAVGFGFITAVVVFLLNAISPDTLATAWARLLDTLVGGAIGLLAYALWPTWSAVPARQALADLLDAQRDYLRAILASLVDGQRADEDEMRKLSRRARLSRTTAEATVARSLSEPETRQIEAEESQGALAAMRRLVQAAHVLRLDAQEDRAHRPLPALAALAGDLDALLSTVEATLTVGPDDRPAPPTLPNLRARYLAFERSARGDGRAEGTSAEVDELVDAANSLAAVVRLDAREDDTDGDGRLADGARRSL